MRRLGKLVGEILSGKMKLFVEIVAPLWAIRYIVNNAVEGNQLSGAAFACAAAFFV